MAKIIPVPETATCNRRSIRKDSPPAPVNVLLFADDLVPKEHQEQMFAHNHFASIGGKQLPADMMPDYFKKLDKEIPQTTRVHKYLSGTEFYVNHETARPYGVYKLAHEIRKKGYTVQVIAHPFYLTEEDVETIFKKFVGDETIAVGSSSSFHSGYNPYGFIDSIYFPTARQRQIRVMLDKINPDVKMIYGGSSIGEEYLRDPTVDSAMLDVDTLFVSYGDVTITEYLDDIKKKQEWPTYTDKGSRLDIQNSTMSYTAEDCVQHGDQLGIETARGCIFKCAFCNFGLIGKEKGTYERGTSLIVDELKRNWEEHGVFKYWVMDDTFNDTNYKLEAVAEAKEKSGVPLDLTVFLRLDLQNRLKQTELIKNCGITSIYYGIETLNPDSAIAIGKGWHPDEQMAYARELKEKHYHDKIKMFTTFIWGLPEDTKESVRADYKKLLDFEYNKFDHVYMNFLFMRDTESYKNSGAVPTEGEAPTGSLIDVNPESYGYTFSGFDEMRKQSGMMNPLRAWKNKHGLTLGNVAKVAYKFNQEYAEKKGWQLATPSSPPHRIKADAVADNKFDMYVQNYWDDIMSIEKHTVYDSVDWVTDGTVTTFKPL
jgi:hypothetical protein